MNVNLRAELGSDTAPAGVTNILGARPGTAAMHGYDEPQHEDQVAMFITFETTHEAMQKVIIPPPLEVDPDAPPVATLMAFMSPKFRGRDGRITPYTGFCFFAPSRYKDTKGQSGWEFVDGAGPAHDKTVPDLLVYTGQVYGMLKKLGDIRFYKNGVELPGDLGPVEDGDEVFVSVDRRGERLAELRLRVGQEVPLSGTATNENRSGAQKIPVLGVREIPTVNYKGYVDRSIVTTQTGPENSSSPKKMWTADPVSLDFWASELEALDLLPVKNLLSANIVVIDGYARSIETMSVLEQLPLNFDNAE